MRSLYSHGQYVAPPGPCPRCKRPAHYEADGPHRRKPARYCHDTRGFGWNTSRTDRKFWAAS